MGRAPLLKGERYYFVIGKSYQNIKKACLKCVDYLIKYPVYRSSNKCWRKRNPLWSPRWAEISKIDQKENFFTSLSSFLWDIPRSGSPIVSGSGSEDPIESEFNPDQDLKHCSKLVKHIVGEILIFWNISGIFSARRGEEGPASQYWKGMGRALDTPQAVIKLESMSPGLASTPSETRFGNETWVDLGYKEVTNQSGSSGGPSLHTWEKTGVLSALVQYQEWGKSRGHSLFKIH